MAGINLFLNNSNVMKLYHKADECSGKLDKFFLIPKKKENVNRSDKLYINAASTS